LEEEKYRQGTRDVVFLDESRTAAPVYVDVRKAIDYIANDKNMRVVGRETISVLPTKNFYVSVDRDLVLANGTVNMADTARLVDRVEWRIDRSYLLKNNIMVLDLLATNNWERPIYFAV